MEKVSRHGHGFRFGQPRQHIHGQSGPVTIHERKVLVPDGGETNFLSSRAHIQTSFVSEPEREQNLMDCFSRGHKLSRDAAAANVREFPDRIAQEIEFAFVAIEMIGLAEAVTNSKITQFYVIANILCILITRVSSACLLPKGGIILWSCLTTNGTYEKR